MVLTKKMTEREREREDRRRKEERREGRKKENHLLPLKVHYYSNCLLQKLVIGGELSIYTAFKSFIHH